MYQDIKVLFPTTAAHFINGQWAPCADTIEVLNPADGSAIACSASGTGEDVNKAVSAAKKAQKDWASKTLQPRSTYLERLIEQVKAHAELLAKIVMHEQGKPLKEAKGEVEMALTMLRFYANLAWKRTGEVLASTRPQHQAITREMPLGVIAAIIPWNYPLAMFARKVAPAIMAGNTIVIKPSEITPLSSVAMATLCVKAGIPDGVVNIVFGLGNTVGDILVRHPDIQLVTMTGSTNAGKAIGVNAAQKVVPVSLELGGKAPFIVMADANIEHAARDAITSRMTNCGQVCICNERTYVQREVWDTFIVALKKAATEIVVGDPAAANTTVGPKVSAAEKAHTESLLHNALKAGATLLWQGTLPNDERYKKGYWVAPAILTDLPENAEILQAEVFGPILPVIPFDTLEEVIKKVNDCEYGLSSYLYTQNLTIAMKASEQLEYGEVYINRIGPEEINGFHSGWKLSGIGGDDGEHGYSIYVRRQTLYINYAE